MRFLIFIFIIVSNHSLLAKEWKSIKQYHKITHKNVLGPGDWLKKDRLNNTYTWQLANRYNLEHSLSFEYKSIVERRDFYKWFSYEVDKHANEVVWVNMAHFILKKMRLMEVFPFSIFTKNDVKNYAREGSQIVFKNAFEDLREIYFLKTILKKHEAEVWDKKMLRKEQFIWLDDLYNTINTKSLKTIERIAKRKFLYALVVPKEVQFIGNLSDAKVRYTYAMEVLRPYCKKAY